MNCLHKSWLLSRLNCVLSTLFFFFLLYSPVQALTHKVKRGEYLSGIAHKYRVSQSAILRLNSLDSPHKIYAGQKLRIPSRKDVQDDGALRRAGNPGLSSPLKSYKVVNRFGRGNESQRKGIVMSARPGNPISSAGNGKVIKVGQFRGFGDFILIDHGGGWITMYSGLQSISVKTGQKVTNSSIIGRVQGQRIFFLVAFRGAPVDPGKYL